MRSRTRLATLLATAGLGLLPLAAGPAPATAAPAEAEPVGRTVITLHDGTDSTGRVLDSVRLNCFPSRGSTHPRPHLACRVLKRAGGDFAKLPRTDRACPMIYQPVTVVAHGSWKGKPTGFARTYPNKCVAGAESSNVFNLTRRAG